MKILVLSRLEFVQLMHEMENVTHFPPIAIISISTEQEGGPTYVPEHLQDGLLRLDFHDIDEPFISVEKPDPAHGAYHGFSREQARHVIDFAIENKDCATTIVHCAAGVSRSGAVGAFLADLHGVPWDEFKRLNPQVLPNVFVSRLLRDTWYGDVKKYDEVFGGVEEEPYLCAHGKDQ